MCRAFDESRKFASLAAAARGDDGEILALIAPIRVDALSSMPRQLTSRAIMFGEPLCYSTPNSTSAMRALLDHHSRNSKHHVLLTEVRSIMTSVTQCPILADQGYQSRPFCNYVINLQASEAELWKNIGKQTRASINRSARRGVRVETGNDNSLKERAHAFIKQSLKRSLVPFPASDLFQNVRHNLGDVLQVRVATYQGEDVAGTVSLAWGDRFFAWYGGTKRLRSVQPFASIVWDEIKWARAQGFRFYDFGGAGDPTQPYGPREFKSRFHGKLVQYGRCTEIYSPRLLALAERGYKSLKYFTGVH